MHSRSICILLQLRQRRRDYFVGLKIITIIIIIIIIITYLLTYLLTYSMEQSPWIANRFAASQGILCILWNPECSLPHLQVPPTCPYPEPARSSPYPHIPFPEDPA